MNTKILLRFFISWLLPALAVTAFVHTSLDKLLITKRSLDQAEKQIIKLKKNICLHDTIVIVTKEIDTITIIEIKFQDSCSKTNTNTVNLPVLMPNFTEKIISFKGQSSSAEIEYKNYNQCKRKFFIKDINLKTSVSTSKLKRYLIGMTAKFQDSTSCNYQNGLSPSSRGLLDYFPDKVEQKNDSLFINYKVLDYSSEPIEFNTNITSITLSAKIIENFLDGKIEWSLKDSGLKKLKIISRFVLPYQLEEIEK